ncbi:crotonobetaine/carnitine-CoA ligase [Stella humosa]|uniref:Crotonobetaine/carnitine-CoA ligase n=1 Tax=Stella humosa TaxID=94 RepID=A0A3N1LYE7_9PROT|nr:class I adenylate-forming enzyme family protein [Stella humosa]ROQ00244.1 crotonobetaine/carnitine-CoA ligase [Stella humosa]BBK30519.1 AMP-binding protein [Stella humosa]
MHPVVAIVQERLRRIEREPFYATMGELLADAARRDPDRLAIVFFERGQQLTYAGLDRAVNRAANALVAIGVRRGDRVAVMLPNRLEYPVTWLALARIGAAMIPVNNGYTPREIAYATTDGGASFAVVDETCMATFLAAPERPAALTDDRIVVVGTSPVGGTRSWEQLIASARDSFTPAEPVTGDDPIGIQYTSGTTGLPKGCLLPQSYWLVLCRSASARTTSQVRRLLVQNLFFYMNAQFLLLTALNIGATLYMAERPSATRFIGWIKEIGANWCIFPEVVLKQPAAFDDNRTALSEVAMAAVSRDGHREIERRFNVRAREIFGMTEVGPGTFMPFEVEDMVGSGSIGAPSLFRRARIRGPEGQEVALGDPGELQITGPSMLKLYVNKPEATARSFDGEWFRTGDVARQDEQGFFYIVGRIKDMIRRGGENIAAVEIESVVRHLPGVIDAAVTAVPDETRGEEVRITIEREAGEGVAREAGDAALLRAIIAHCEANLARFKIPRYYAFADTLPRTASNKLAKHQIVAAGSDPRAGTFDRIDGIWRP